MSCCIRIKVSIQICKIQNHAVSDFESGDKVARIQNEICGLYTGQNLKMKVSVKNLGIRFAFSQKSVRTTVIVNSHPRNNGKNRYVYFFHLYFSTSITDFVASIFFLSTR